MTEPKKPEKKTRQFYYYDWFAFEDYLRAKYPDYPKTRDFWEYLCSQEGFRNFSYVLLDLEMALEGGIGIKREVQITAELIRDEIELSPESTHMFWVSW